VKLCIVMKDKFRYSDKNQTLITLGCLILPKEEDLFISISRSVVRQLTINIGFVHLVQTRMSPVTVQTAEDKLFGLVWI